jgi:large subunit ribosomal protein L21
MKYAIIRLQGHQYKVTEGKELLVDKLNEEKVEPEILLLVDGDKILIGKPVLSKTNVKLKIVSKEEKGDKIDVIKFKAKSRYRRHIGFRPIYTRLLVEEIS